MALMIVDVESEDTRYHRVRETSDSDSLCRETTAHMH